MAQEDFRRVVESLRVAVAVADGRGNLLFVNDALAEMAGAEPREMSERLLAELFRASDRRRIAQTLARVADGKAAFAFADAPLVTADLSERWVQVGFQATPDSHGKGGVVAVFQDIGTQRETEAALNLLTARLIALAEHSAVATLIETAPGDIELVNVPFIGLLGLDSAPQSLSGLPVKDVLSRSERIDARALGAALRSTEEVATLTLHTPDAGAVELERHPLVVDDEPAGAVWTARTAGEAASTSSRSGVEIGVIERMGEELSVALEGISAVTILAEQINLDAPIVERIQEIRTATQTALTAIGDLVDFSRVSGGIVLRRREFLLRDALARLIERIIGSAEEHGCRLRIKVEQDVAEALEGDLERLQIVLKNLIGNAFRLLPGAEIGLQITPEYATRATIQLSFSVMAAGADSQRLAARIAPDSGMEVAVARFMVEAMGGKLAIAPRPVNDVLYAFTIEFPLREAPAPPRRPSYVSLVGLTALVVSADPQQRLTVSSMLRNWRMVPLEADNAPMALKLLERMHEEGAPVPLVIVANKLPVQDGFLLSFRIKHHPRLHDALVIMLASEGRPGDAIACRENGIAAYMRYPIHDRQLNEAIIAVTGASVDADETPTLVTRHSLREQRKGATILLVDPSRDSQILTAHVLGRHDCSVVVAQDKAEALSALDQDLYDIVIVDVGLPGLGDADAAQELRQRMPRGAENVQLVAASQEHSARFAAERKAAGFDATLAKPFRREDLLALLKPLLSATR
jgi:PAS domain S-box-containing protein